MAKFCYIQTLNTPILLVGRLAIVRNFALFHDAAIACHTFLAISLTENFLFTKFVPASRVQRVASHSVRLVGDI